mgnify:CR=1 FL=1
MCFLITSKQKKLLYVPDIDKWKLWERDILQIVKSVDYALIDGTFWDENELKNRKMDKIPHPTISESLELLGKKRFNDPEIYFIHLNHTNPANDESSIQRKKIDSMGWGVVSQGSIFSI